jgi:hypothetical protein
MIIEERNKFDEQNPFEIIRAEDFGEDLFDFYQPLGKIFRKVSNVDIEGTRPVFLVGGRGTGKTMVLKYLSFEMQYKEYIKNILNIDDKSYTLSENEMLDFLKKSNFIAIYLKFRTTEYDVFVNDLKPLFLPITSLKIAERIFNILDLISKSNMISRESEKKIVSYFFDQIKSPQVKRKNTFKDTIESIKLSLIPMFEEIFTSYATYSIDEIKKKYEMPIIISKNIFFKLPEIVIQEIEPFENKNIFYLCDEFEFLSEYQKNSIAMLIKDSDGTPVIFKIGTRFMPKKISVGDSDEILQHIHDYRIINITDALNKAQGGKKFDYSNLIKSILNKRIAKSIYFKKCGITKIEQLFPNIAIVVEAKSLVKGRTRHWRKFQNKLQSRHTQDEISQIIDFLKYPDDPIIEKLNMLLYYRGKKPEEIHDMYNEYLANKNSQYTNLYQKNSLNLLFQLYNDYRSSKIYSGIDTIIFLSSGVIRYAIELCNQSVKTAKNYGYSFEKCGPIPNRIQDTAAKYHSDISFSDIREISSNMGLTIQTLANEIGTIFRALHLNQDLIEPEPTHFETRYSELNAEARMVIDTAIGYGILQEKPPMEPKNAHETKRNDYILNRILAPHFEISYRVRGRTQIDSELLQELITSNENKRKEIRIAIIKANSKVDSIGEKESIVVKYKKSRRIKKHTKKGGIVKASEKFPIPKQRTIEEFYGE